MLVRWILVVAFGMYVWTLSSAAAEPPHPEQVDKISIRRTVRAHLDEIAQCNERGGPGDDLCTGRVVIGWQISATGGVSEVAIVENGLRNRAVARCLAAAVKAWRFPPLAGPSPLKVRYPFHVRCAGQ